MKRIQFSLAITAGLVAGTLSWAAGASSLADSYTKIEAASLVHTPQNAWARAILFTDVMEVPPSGHAQRLDRKNYIEMKLQTAGKAWVPEELAPKFQALQKGSTYSFAGTVDQISRRYYLIVDACYTIQTAADMNEHWTDMLNPPAPDAPPALDNVSETAMQSLLLQAQNSLITLAKENNTSVAQLIEAQVDGGQRIAENIVADALHGELKSQNKTAEELMIGAVLALLQKQAVLQESAKIAEENTALPPALPEPSPLATNLPPAEVAAVVEEVSTAPVDEPVMETSTPMSEINDETPVMAAEEELATPASPEVTVETAASELAVSSDQPAEIPATEPTVEPTVSVPNELPVEMAAIEPVVSPEQPAEIPATEPTVEAAAVTALAETPAIAEKSDNAKSANTKTKKKKVKGSKIETVAKTAEESAPPAEVPLEAMLPAVEVAEEVPAEPAEMQATVSAGEGTEVSAVELILPTEEAPGHEAVAPPPTSMLVVPLTEPSPEVIPLVSVQPTKAELALQKKNEAEAERERILAARKAAAEEAARQQEADRLTRIEAKRLAAAEKQAIAEARQAELAQKQAEEQRVKEEAAARKAIEWKAQQDQAKAEAEAKKARAEEAKRLAQEEKQALEALRQADILQKQADSVRLLREETENRLAELVARKEAAEAGMRAAEKQKQAALKKLQEEADAQAVAQAAEREAKDADEKAQQAEDLRIAQEVAQHETQAAQKAAEQIAVEVATRKDAEEKIKQMEQEIREMDTRANQVAEPAKTQPAKDASLDTRKQEAAARKAEWLANKEAAAAEKAAAKTKATAEQERAIEAGELPEWMQPVQF